MNRRADDSLSDVQIDALLDEVDAVHDALSPAARAALREAVEQVEHDHVARRRRRWFVVQGLAAAAAGIVAVTAVVTTLVLRPGGTGQARTVQPNPTASSHTKLAQPGPNSGFSVKQQDPNSGVLVSIKGADNAWGTVLEVEISGMPGPAKGTLVAVSRAGIRTPVASWFTPEPVPGGSKPITVTGTIAVRWYEIATFRVSDESGRVLLEAVAS